MTPDKSDNSDTPETNSEEYSCDPKYSRPIEDYVGSDFARRLERRLNAANAKITALAALRGEELLHTCINHTSKQRENAGCPVCLRADRDRLAAELEQAKQALDAAERTIAGKLEHPNFNFAVTCDAELTLALVRAALAAARGAKP